MTARWLRPLVLGALVVLVVVVVGVGLVIATPVGTRLVASVVNQSTDGIVSVDEPSGTLLAGAQFGSIRVAVDGTTVMLRGTRIDIALSALLRGALDIDALTIEAVDVALRPSSNETSTTSETPSIPGLPVPLRISRLQIATILVQSNDSTVTADADVALTWQGSAIELNARSVSVDGIAVHGKFAVKGGDSPRLDADIAWRTVAPLAPAAGALLATGSLSSLAIEHELLEPLLVTTSGDVALRPSALPIVALTHEWPVQTLEPFTGAATRVGAGSLETVGPIQGARWQLRTSLAHGAYTAAVTANGGLEASALSVERALAVIDEVGQLQFDGRIAWPGGIATATANVAMDLRTVPVEGLQLPQRVNVAATVAHAPDSTAVPVTTVVFGEPSVSDIGGRLRLRNGEVALQALALAVGDDELRVDGTVDSAAIDVEAALAVNNVGDYWPAAAGTMAGRAAASGAWSEPTISVDLTATGVTGSSFSASQTTLVATAQWPTAADVRVEINDLTTAGRPVGQWALQYQGAVDEHRWQLDGRHDGFLVAAKARGGWQVAQRYRLDWEAAKLGNPDRGEWVLAQSGAALTLSHNDIQQTPFCLQGAGSLCVAGAWVDGVGSLSVSLKGLPLEPLSSWAFREMRVVGDLAADVEVRYRDGLADGTFGVRLPDAKLIPVATSAATERSPLPFSVVLDADVTNGQAKTAAIIDIEALGDVRVDASIADLTDAASPIAVQANGSLSNLESLDAWLPFVGIDKANAIVDADITGTIREPVGRVTVALDDALARIAATGTRIGETRFAVAKNRGSDWVVNGTSRIGNGELAIDGAIDWPTQGGWSGEIALTGYDLAIAELPELAVTVAPQLTLRRDTEALTIAGDVAVPYARIRPIETPPGAIEPSADTDIVGARAGDETDRGVRQQIDVRVALGDDVQLDGYGLASRVQGTLRLQGLLPDQVRGFGNITLVDGRFKAYGQSLSIDQGELLFGGDLTNPGLNLVATRAVTPGLVGVRIAGSVSEPVSTLTSSPSLPQAETLAWLVTGRGLSEADSDQESTLSDAAVALGLTRLGAVTGRLREQLGLDTLSVATEGADDGQLLAGKWIGERLYLQYAVGIFDKLGSVMVRYQINDRLRFESRTGTEQSLDLVYTVGQDN
ncbi:MAG: translocation/assembly module TamB domain-containing protein [Pseudomonadota bacterium]